MNISVNQSGDSIIIGADVGGTDIKRGVSSHGGDPLSDTLKISKLPSLVREGPAKTLEQIEIAVNDLLAQNPSSTLGAIGVACAGNISRDGVVVRSANFGDTWRDFPLKKELEERFKVPVVCENDANAAAIAEHRELAKESVVLAQGPGILLTIGTGLGTGMFNSEGKLERGANGFAVELGHLPMRRTDAISSVDLFKEQIVCGCGLFECVEQYTSLSFIERELFARQNEHPTHELYSIPNRRDAAKKVLGKAIQGDPFCLSIIDSQATNVGSFIGEFLRAEDVRWFLIGGGITEASDALRFRYMRKVLKKVEHFVGKDRLDQIKVAYAALGDNAGWVGASISASQLLEKMADEQNHWPI
jgi:glucokinase